MQLLIYTARKTSRTEYIFSTLFNALGITHQTTDDVSFYTNYAGSKLNYSSTQTNNEFWIPPVELLFQQEIKAQVIECFDWNDHKAFFRTTGGDIPFDIFAASFYLITRYEEYLPHSLDSYGRYAHENSIAFQEGFLQLPLVNLWLKEFGKLLQEKFPALSLQPSSFRFIPTYDIDMAWSYKSKGVVRNAGGLLRSIVNGQWSIGKERVDVLLGKRPDPFDIYEWLDGLHKKYGGDPYYFFLLAKKNKGYDKNISPSNKSFQKLIQHISSKYEVGIHPSWQSGDDVALLGEEVAALQTITGKKAKSSRQHYVRMKLPDTYRQLISAGISEDFSMGYGSINGFRASYCLPYKWYDLNEDKETELTVYPFCFMEANSYYEQHYSLEQAAEELDYYYQIVKQVDGVMITIWHNHILGNKQLFDGWKEMYEQFMSNIVDAKR